MLAEIGKPPCPSPLPSAFREVIDGRYDGYTASRRRISVMISAWLFFRFSIGSAWQRKWMWVGELAPIPVTPIDGSICATPSMPLISLSSLNDTSVVPSSEVPSGASTCTVQSPMSSLGTNSRPTIRLSGKVSSTVTTEIAMISVG